MNPFALLRSQQMRRHVLRENVSVGKNFAAGPNVTIWAPRKLVIGDDVYVGRNSTIEVDGQIGDHVLIANNVGVVGRRDHDILSVGNSIRYAPGVRDEPERLSLPIDIGSDCWIGFGAILLSGISIGDHSIVAAGSVVGSSVPSNTIVAGNPAMPVRPRFSQTDLVRHRLELQRRGVRVNVH